jgi:RecA-family ATPase
MYSNLNVGLVTGTISNNIFAVDVDCGEGKQGDESIQALQVLNDDLPPTMETKTGGGGRHYYYRAPKGMLITTGKNVLGAGVDVRGEGGFLVAGGSTHASGGVYVCDFAPIADAPGWLLDRVTVSAQQADTGRMMQGATSNSANPFKSDDGREGVMVNVILATICNFYEQHSALPTSQQVIDLGFDRYVSQVASRIGNLEAEDRGITLFTERVGYQLSRARRGSLRVLEALKEKMAQEAARGQTIAQQLSTPTPKPKEPAAPTDTQEWDVPGVPTAVIAEAIIQIEQKVLNIADWAISRFTGTPPPVVWIVENTISLGIAAMLCAVGGLGKSFMALDLALKVAGGGDRWDDLTLMALGGRIKTFGKVVYLTAEDSKDAIHRRLDSIADPKLRERAKDRLFVVPLADAGGSFPWIAEDSAGLHLTDAYKDLRQQLINIGGVVLLIVDPLQAFVHADITASPAAAQFWWSTVSELCSALGATVLVTHHMRKDGAFDIRNRTDARQAIRGTTALVDGARLVYGLWGVPEDEDRDACRVLDMEPGQGNIVKGAILKTNEFADVGERIFRRGEQGLLEDCTAEVEEKLSEASSLNFGQITEIMREVKHRFDTGSPFAATVKSRSANFPFWLSTQYGLPRKVADSRMNEWLGKQMLVARINEQTGSSGLQASEAGASSKHRGGHHD